MQDLIPMNPGIAALPSGGRGTPSRDLAQAAEQFEAYYIQMMLEQMRKTVGSGGLFEGRETKGYESFMYDALANRAAESHSFGLADQILEQLRSRFPEEFMHAPVDLQKGKP